MAFLANLLVIRIGLPNPLLTYGLLMLSLVGGLMLLYSAGLTHLPPLLGKVAVTLVLTLPLFFSGFAFSAELKTATSVAGALSSNLLGAMLGGCLEYNSMYLGYQSLYFFAIGMYVLAFCWSIRLRRA
ncbi:hypothetical protein ACFL01_04735 [Planctomycetota bacterium]